MTTNPDAVLAALLPEDCPEYAAVSWVAAVFGIRPSTVHNAIHKGRLPAIEVHGSTRAIVTYAIRPVDAALVWGHKLRKAKI